MEHLLDQQKSVDLHLEKDGKKTAVEISITTDTVKELANIQKCLDAGYDQIIVLCADNQTLENLKKRANQQYLPAIQAKLNITPITNLLQAI